MPTYRYVGSYPGQMPDRALGEIQPGDTFTTEDPITDSPFFVDLDAPTANPEPPADAQPEPPVAEPPAEAPPVESEPQPEPPAEAPPEAEPSEPPAE